MQTKILLIYTGGTIGMVKDYQDQSLKPFDFHNILDKIPELSLINAQIECQSMPKPIDSSDVTPQDWQLLGELIYQQYDNYSGFVVLHGTDTMAYTASALSFMFQDLDKPIIFTGSQLPIGDLRTDAKENLISSLHYATLQKNGQPLLSEVCLYFEYKLYRANRTTKISAEHFDAFSSPNYPLLGESGVYLEINESLLMPKPKAPVALLPKFSNQVALLKIFPGMNLDFVAQGLSSNQIEVLVLETYGSGNLNTRTPLIPILEKKVAQGMQIIVTTQCAGGKVALGKYSSSKPLLEMGAISGLDLTTEAAVTKAMWVLGQYKKSSLSSYFEKDLRGECSPKSKNNFS